MKALLNLFIVLCALHGANSLAAGSGLNRDNIRDYIIDDTSTGTDKSLSAAQIIKRSYCSVADYGVTSNDGTDDTTAMQAALNACNAVYLPPGTKYNLSNLVLDTDNQLYSDTTRGPADGGLSSAPILVFNLASSGSAISASGTSISDMSLSGFDMIISTANYDNFIELPTTSGVRFSNIKMYTTQTAVGGIVVAKNDPGDNSWTMELDNVQVRLPDAATAYALDVDVSDSHVIGSSFTGGRGSIFRGAGQVRIVGGRFDRSNDCGITLSKENEAAGIYNIVGNEIEENTDGGICINADADDGLTSDDYMFSIVGNGFRDYAASSEIVLTNATGSVMHGGVISGNSFTAVTSPNPISYDPARWLGLSVGANSQLNGINQPNNYLDDDFLPSPLVLAQSAVAVSHTGNTSETTLASVTIPSGAIGPNGRVRVNTTWTRNTGGAGNTTARVYFGATAYTDVPVSTTNQTFRFQTEIANRNSASSQVGASANYLGFGQTTAAKVTSSIDTTAAVTLSIKGLLANPGDTITLESYSVEVLRGE